MTLSDGFAPFYAERKVAVYGELSQYYLTYASIAILSGILLILPGVRGRGKARLSFLLRWTTVLFIGTAIVACAQGVSWHEATVTAIMPYRARSNAMERFEIGLHIGLSKFNVSLRGNSPSHTDQIKMSEEFYFLGSDMALEKGLKIGLPYPILRVLENFTINRISSIWLWGRRYWLAGHYAEYMVWAAFATWFFSILLLNVVVRYGGLMLAMTGFLLVAANLAFFSVGDGGQYLTIELGYYESATLRPTFGWSFWLCLAVGILCIVCGMSIFLADRLCSHKLRQFFNKKKKDEENEFLEIQVDFSSGDSRRSSEGQSDEASASYAFHKSSTSTDDEGNTHAKRLARKSEKRSSPSITSGDPNFEMTTEAIVNIEKKSQPRGSTAHGPSVRKNTSVVSFSEQFLASDRVEDSPETQLDTTNNGHIEDVQM